MDFIVEIGIFEEKQASTSTVFTINHYNYIQKTPLLVSFDY